MAISPPFSEFGLVVISTSQCRYQTTDYAMREPRGHRLNSRIHVDPGGGGGVSGILILAREGRTRRRRGGCYHTSGWPGRTRHDEQDGCKSRSKAGGRKPLHLCGSREWAEDVASFVPD